MAHASEMRRLLYGYLLARALCAMAELGLADQLAGAELTLAGLADRTAADPSGLSRLLRCLAAFNVITAHPAGTFSLTPLGETLRSDLPGTALPTAMLISAVVGPAWNELSEVVRTGEPSFPKVFASDFFAHIDGDPRLRQIFDHSQQAGLALEVDEIIRSVHFADSGVLVDIGGGDGALLEALLAVHPNLGGILIERPGVLSHAVRRMAESGMSDRVEFQSGDFFTDLPTTADSYLLRHILHNWDDLNCAALLRECRRVMKEHAQLIIIEQVIDVEAPASRSTQAAALMDLYMMSLFGGGRERTRGEFDALLESAGFISDSFTPLCTGTGVITAHIDERRYK